MEEFEIDDNIRVVRFLGNKSHLHIVKNREYGVLDIETNNLIKGTVAESTLNAVLSWLLVNNL